MACLVDVPRTVVYHRVSNLLSCDNYSLHVCKLPTATTRCDNHDGMRDGWPSNNNSSSQQLTSHNSTISIQSLSFIGKALYNNKSKSLAFGGYNNKMTTT